MRERWNKPKTTRRYLNPPRSERLHTLWAEGKLVFGEVYAPGGLEDYTSYISSGIWFVRGRESLQLDFHNTKNIIREDGVPIHGIINDSGDLSFEIEAFSSYERVPKCFIKLAVRNKSEEETYERIGFVMRRGREDFLVKNGPDIYRSYSPELSAWLRLEPSFEYSDGVFRDGENYFDLKSDVGFTYDREKGIAFSDLTLKAGESFVAYLCFGEGEAADFDYNEEAEKVILRWNDELSKIKNLPRGVKEDPEAVKMIRHLTATILQNFNYPKGDDFLLARQGGLSRMVWPYESMPVLEALCKMGDFSDYVEPIIDSYFTKMQDESGEVVPFGIHWAMCTANALYSFCKYALVRGKEYFDKYRDRAYKAFLWIKKTRASTVPEGDIIAGLFPPRRSCDDELVFQGYGNTDSFNLRGLNAASETFAYFKDAAREEIKAEYDSYLGVMRKAWSDISARSSTDELRVPFTPYGDDTEVEKMFVFGHFGAYITEAIDIPESDAERVINYYTRRGFIKGGLYDRMPDKDGHDSTVENLDEDGKCAVWYVTAHEYLWFKYFMRHGMRDRAKEIIDDSLRFAMTEEYYMLERYKETDPYFVPWSPNVSANGRLIDMLFDYYG